jgi:hypothetical protein
LAAAGGGDGSSSAAVGDVVAKITDKMPKAGTIHLAHVKRFFLTNPPPEFQEMKTPGLQINV